VAAWDSWERGFGLENARECAQPEGLRIISLECGIVKHEGTQCAGF
jgi:hypothetical protein